MSSLLTYTLHLEILDDDTDGSDDQDYKNSSESESGIAETEDDDQSDVEEGDGVQGAEVEIEGDFECVPQIADIVSRSSSRDSYSSRLIANIRGVDGPSGSALLSRDWDFNLEEQDAEFRDDLRAASGIGRSKKRVRC